MVVNFPYMSISNSIGKERISIWDFRACLRWKSDILVNSLLFSAEFNEFEISLSHITVKEGVNFQILLSLASPVALS